ncbi:hypothetical protein HK099_006563 [Clydaea vesicula]|uniref:Uncharacterized protein n=1 Tax=Clydaea vesicula TaxID=447962 RepID=A0AAD5TY53_9FUNG|nr:hypothetical protein HK099_006563 [Clydaea vesicula]KAJ3386434.1 hypothetical protein HDU92_002441 [Lobulomyces angularis]
MYLEDINVNETDLIDGNGINLTVELESSPKKARERNSTIERQLRKEKREAEMKDIKKVLILGAGDSGKSTLVRQIRLTNAVPFTGEEKNFFKKVIWGNILLSMKNLVIGSEFLGININSWDFLNDAILIKEYVYDKKLMKIEDEVCNALRRLWDDPNIKVCFERRNEIKNLHIQDTSVNYFNDLNRILDCNYEPTDQDIVLSRRATLNITETSVSIKLGNFKFFDVGGQKHLRNFWAPYFDEVNAIIFVAALSSFNEVMEEDDSTNRMVDCISLFKAIVNNPLLTKAPIILFFNKNDLFKEKLKTYKLVNYFSDYKEQQTEKSAVSFFTNKFKETTNRNLSHIHLTTGTDNKLMKKIIGSVLEIIMRGRIEAVL